MSGRGGLDVLELLFFEVPVKKVKEASKTVKGGGLDILELWLVHEGNKVRIGPLEDEAFAELAGDWGDGYGSVVTGEIKWDCFRDGHDACFLPICRTLTLAERGVDDRTQVV